MGHGAGERHISKNELEACKHLGVLVALMGCSSCRMYLYESFKRPIIPLQGILQAYISSGV